MTTRRQMIAGLGAALIATRTAFAQQKSKLPQIGYVGNSTSALEASLVAGFRQGLKERGYVEGESVIVHYRWADGKISELPALISQLLGLKVDVLVTAGTPSALAAKKATTTVP